MQNSLGGEVVKTNWIKATITEGTYKGKPIEVQFGKQMKIMCAGKDITNYLMALHIKLDADGQVLYLKIVEMENSQVPSETWEKMVDDKTSYLPPPFKR